ncbi:hypothetical protein HOD29_02610 [archaeon]|jgi:hypothetical protein|nr:hypothetical protein [archaeon]
MGKLKNISAKNLISILTKAKAKSLYIIERKDIALADDPLISRLRLANHLYEGDEEVMENFDSNEPTVFCTSRDEKSISKGVIRFAESSLLYGTSFGAFKRNKKCSIRIMDKFEMEVTPLGYYSGEYYNYLVFKNSNEDFVFIPFKSLDKDTSLIDIQKI